MCRFHTIISKCSVNLSFLFKNWSEHSYIRSFSYTQNHQQIKSLTFSTWTSQSCCLAATNFILRNSNWSKWNWIQSFSVCLRSAFQTDPSWLRGPFSVFWTFQWESYGSSREDRRQLMIFWVVLMTLWSAFLSAAALKYSLWSNNEEMAAVFDASCCVLSASCGLCFRFNSTNSSESPEQESEASFSQNIWENLDF